MSSPGRNGANGVIVNWMARRFVPLMLAVIVGMSPTAHVLCGVLCAQLAASPSAATHGHHRSAHSAAGPEAPAHHIHRRHSHTTPDAETPAAGRSDEPAMTCRTLSLSEAATRCIHDGGLQAASAPGTKLVVDPPDALPQVVEGVGPPGSAPAILRVASVARPPIPLALRTPLRV